jgi:excisionase family DNA binding protein
MPEFYTLDEAARVLGMSPEELKTKAQRREIRAFMDGGSWRFKKFDIEEEARRRGIGSNPDLSLSDLDLVAQQGESGSGDDIDFTEFQLGAATPDLAPPSREMPRPGSDEGDILLDERTVPPAPSGSSSTIIGMRPTSKKQPTDSDVRLVPDNTKGASDSDVRLGAKLPSDSDVKLAGGRTVGGGGSSGDIFPAAPSAREHGSDEIDPHATMLQPSPVLGSSDEIPAADSGSDFELTPSSVIDALEPESGSDFELTALDGSSDEFDATPMRGPSDSDVTGAAPSTSGVNLGRPSDSGINLQAVGGFDMQADSIELAPLDDDEPARPAAAKPAAQAPASKPAAKPAPKPAPKKEEVDLSATALPVRADKDIFEDTDFEVDALDTGSSDDQTVQLEAASDFDVEDSDSASEVFAIDEEDVDQNAATAMGPAVKDERAALPDDDDEGPDSAWDVEEPAAATTTTSRAVAPVLAAGAGAGPEWGGLWVGLLAVASVLTLLLAFVGIDVVRNLYEFQGEGPASGLVHQLAGLIGG